MAAGYVTWPAFLWWLLPQLAGVAAQFVRTKISNHRNGVTLSGKQWAVVLAQGAVGGAAGVGLQWAFEKAPKVTAAIIGAVIGSLGLSV